MGNRAVGSYLEVGGRLSTAARSAAELASEVRASAPIELWQGSVVENAELQKPFIDRIVFLKGQHEFILDPEDLAINTSTT